MMYLGDLSEVIKLRITPDQKQFCIDMAEHYGISPSAFIRMLIDLYLCKYEGDSHYEDE